MFRGNNLIGVQTAQAVNNMNRSTPTYGFGNALAEALQGYQTGKERADKLKAQQEQTAWEKERFGIEQDNAMNRFNTEQDNIMKRHDDTLRQAYIEARTKQYEPTTAMRNYGHLISLGVPKEKALAMSYSGNTDAVGGVVANDLSTGLGMAGQRELDKARGQTMAEQEKKKIEARQALNFINNINNRFFGDNGLVARALIDNVVDRRISTELVPKGAQEARQEMQNLLGSLRLDQMQYLKGALSDTEQEFLNDMIAGNIHKYSPQQIQGALNGLALKFNTILNWEMQPQQAQPQPQETIIDSSEYFK